MLFEQPSTVWLRYVCAVLLFHALFFAGAVHGITAAPEMRRAFEGANRLYERGKFSDAAEEYEKLLQSEHLSVPLLFNAGNAYFQNGQLGHAIAAYRRAEMLAPRDPDVRANLELARNKTGHTNTPTFLHNFPLRLSWGEWSWIFTCATWIWFGCLAWDSWRKGNPHRGRRAIVGTAWLIVVILFGFVSYQRLETVDAVVVVREAAARRGPLAESQTAFTLRDGAEVRVAESRETWYQVADGKRRGWVRRGDLVVLPR